MAKTEVTNEIHSFSRGLITEVSPFDFPQDAVSDIENLEITKFGTLKRRKGIDYESSFALTSKTCNGSLRAQAF